VGQFNNFAAETAATLEKVKGKESLAEIVNEIAGWLGVETGEQSPNRLANMLPYSYLPTSAGMTQVTRNDAGRTGLHPRLRPQLMPMPASTGMNQVTRNDAGRTGFQPSGFFRHRPHFVHVMPKN